jgi:hypothetical protein
MGMRDASSSAEANMIADAMLEMLWTSLAASGIAAGVWS